MSTGLSSISEINAALKIIRRYHNKIIKGKIQVNNQSKKEIEKQLEKAKFPKLGKSHDDKNKSYQYLGCLYLLLLFYNGFYMEV